MLQGPTQWHVQIITEKLLRTVNQAVIKMGRDTPHVVSFQYSVCFYSGLSLFPPAFLTCCTHSILPVLVRHRVQLPQAHCNPNAIPKLFLKSTSAELFAQPQWKIDCDNFISAPLLLHVAASFLLHCHYCLNSSRFVFSTQLDVITFS